MYRLIHALNSAAVSSIAAKVPHTCVNELGHHWPVRRQAITCTNACLLSTERMGTYFSEIWIRNLTFSFRNMQQKMPSAKVAAILSSGRWVKGRTWVGNCILHVNMNEFMCPDHNHTKSLSLRWGQWITGHTLNVDCICSLFHTSHERFS